MSDDRAVDGVAAVLEGFQTPAVTNIPTLRRPASGNLQATKPREGARIRRKFPYLRDASL
jgi:hypothetical protein